MQPRHQWRWHDRSTPCPKSSRTRRPRPTEPRTPRPSPSGPTHANRRPPSRRHRTHSSQRRPQRTDGTTKTSRTLRKMRKFPIHRRRYHLRRARTRLIILRTFPSRSGPGSRRCRMLPRPWPRPCARRFPLRPQGNPHPRHQRRSTLAPVPPRRRRLTPCRPPRRGINGPCIRNTPPPDPPRRSGQTLRPARLHS